MDRSVIVKGRKVARKNLVVFLGGVVLLSSAHYALNNLQSSLYVEAGLGTAALSTQYASMLATGLFAAPIVTNFLSTKTCLLIADICISVFAVASFYPSYYTLVPANMVTGFGKSLFWICSGEYIVYFTQIFDLYGSKDLETYRGKVNGVYFAAFQSCQIFGNAITYLVFVLSGGNATPDPTTSSGHTTEEFVSTMSNIYTDTTSPYRSNHTYSISDVCGAKDCQDPEVSLANADQYSVPNDITLYLMMSVFLAMHIFSFVLHCFVVDISNVDAPENEENEISGAVNTAYVEDYNGNLCKSAKDGTEDSNNNCVKDDKTNSIRCEDLKDIKNYEGSEIQIDDAGSVSQMKIKFYQSINEIKINLKHFKKPFQMMLVPMLVHTGLNISFVAAEITRAYVACVFSVTEIGLAMTCYGASSFVSAFIAGKICVLWGRKIVSCIGLVTNCAALAFCLGWIPNDESSEWIALALVSVYGIVDGIWQVMTSIFSATLFPDDAKRTFTCWSFWTAVGFLVQFSWSTAVCVEYKIYVMFGTLFLGFTTYMIAEIKFTRLGVSQLIEPNV